jgi:hypothetical protein
MARKVGRKSMCDQLVGCTSTLTNNVDGQTHCNGSNDFASHKLTEACLSTSNSAGDFDQDSDDGHDAGHNERESST